MDEFLTETFNCQDRVSPVSNCDLEAKLSSLGHDVYLSAAMDSFYSLVVLVSKYNMFLYFLQFPKPNCVNGKKMNIKLLSDWSQTKGIIRMDNFIPLSITSQYWFSSIVPFWYPKKN